MAKKATLSSTGTEGSSSSKTRAPLNGGKSRGSKQLLTHSKPRQYDPSQEYHGRHPSHQHGQAKIVEKHEKFLTVKPETREDTLKMMEAAIYFLSTKYGLVNSV
jgi:hypothetical protein